MDVFSRIFDWLSDHEAGISAVAAIIVIGGVILGGLRLVVRRRGDTAPEVAPSASADPASAAEAPAPDLDPLTVPGFEGRPAIAVLPFDDLSSKRDQEYFADGIAEDLITRLSARRGFPVIARNSSFTYKGKAVDVKQVSRELGARYVVEGSVRRSEGRVRVSAQLIDATTGHHIWAETYDREIQGIFAMQDEITEEIVASMHLELVHLESARVARTDPHNLDAYECFLRGTWHLGQRTGQDCKAARGWFEKATELDPKLAEGFVGIATTHNLDVAYHWTDDPERSLAEQSRAARKGVALDPRSPEGQVELAWSYLRSGHRDEAIQAFEHAIALDPSHARAHADLGLAFAFALSGRSDDALESLEKAMRLNPRSPRLWYWLDGMAWAHFAGGRYEEAIEWAQRSCKVNPDQPWAYRVLAASHALLNQLEEARWALREELRLEPDITIERIRLEIPWADPDFLERYFDGLRKAGLPEGTEA